MHKETKALLQENNQRETLLSPNFQSVLTDMVVYLRASRLPFSLQEQVRRDITDMFLAGQEKGASPAEIIGMDFQEYCDRLLQELPQNNRRTQTLCTIRDMSLVLCVGMAVLFLPELIGVLLSHTPFLTLTLGKLIFLIALITFAYAPWRISAKTLSSLRKSKTLSSKTCIFYGCFWVLYYCFS